MKNNNRKYIHTIVIASSVALAIGIGASSVYGYSSWIFTDSQVGERNVEAFVPDWSFDGGGDLEPGTIIEVDEDGNVYINGEKIDDAQVSTEGGVDTFTAGDVTIKFEVDEDGNVVLSEFTTSPNIWGALVGNDFYLPKGILIDGVEHPVTGVSEPLQLNTSYAFFGGKSVHVPDTYTYLCDGAFASLTDTATFYIPASIQHIGSGAFAPRNNVTQTINYAGSQAQWNAIDKATNYENGRGSVTINYNAN